jgi:HEAT repeat protein
MDRAISAKHSLITPMGGNRSFIGVDSHIPPPLAAAGENMIKYGQTKSVSTEGTDPMKIVSIEPTPSPNTMKLNMDERLPKGVSINVTREHAEGAPEYVRKLLQIPGVAGVFQVADFIALQRHPKADWQAILSGAREVLDGIQDARPANGMEETPQEGFGEVQVFVQTFRGIPMQVKVLKNGEETRFGLPERFMEAAMKLKMASPNVIMERKWEERGVRYGDVNQVGEELVKEIAAAYDAARLTRMVQAAFRLSAGETVQEERLNAEEVASRLDDPDWEKRYAALSRMKQPDQAALPVLRKALSDPHVSVRRMAVAYLGEVRDADVLLLLFEALKDKSPIVRRTAGDTLSDIGDPRAIGPMSEALRDENKLVRWRAARYLYEVGDESALPALREAQNDPEFEVQLQVRMALQRIEKGEEAGGTVWQQMTRAIEKKNDEKRDLD